MARAAWVVAAVLAIAACGRDRGERCADVAARADHAATIARCTAAYERDGAVTAGVAAALAHVARGDDEAVVAWAERLGDAPAAAIVWRRAAGVHGKRQARGPMLRARERALRAWEAAGKPGEAAYEALEIATAEWTASAFAPALAAARRGHALAMHSDDRQMQVATFGFIFTILFDLGDFAGAAQAIDQARGLVPPANTELRRYLLGCEGLLRFREGRPALARAAYHAALALAEPPADPVTLRSIHYNLVEIELALGDLAAARRALAAARAHVPPDAPPHARSASAYFGALVALAAGEPARAEADAWAALAADPIADWRWQLEHARGRALEAQGDLAGAAAAYARAIDVVEQLRRDVAVEALQLAVRDKKRAPYEAAFELAVGAGDHARALALAEQMWTRRFAEAFAGTDAGIAVADGGDPLAAKLGALALIHAALPPARAPAAGPHDVLAWIEARGTVWRYLQLGTRSTLDRAPLPAPAIAELVDRLRADPDDRAVAAQLGAALVPPAVTAGARPLHLIADGALGGAPLAALVVGGRRLIEMRVLAIVPSRGALATPPPRATTAPVVLGVPGRAPRALAAARAEAVDTAAALGVRPVLDDAATSAVLRRAGSASLLHVAAHGGIDPRGAYVELADRRVDAADVLAWRLAPRVVVLASCASGARPGRTLWGAMGAAFLAAGSHAVVATLWSVADEPARRLIGAFYGHDGAREPHAALATAQRRAIAAGRPASEWAPFVVLGAAR